MAVGSRGHWLRPAAEDGAMHRGEALLVYETRVDAAWIDDNDHMSDAAYALVFSRAVDALMDRIGLDAAQRKATRRTLYAAQAMHRYFAEALAGDALTVSLRLLEHDDKRMRVWFEMSGRDGVALAASEQTLLSIDRGGAKPRVANWRAETRSALDALAKAQRDLAAPSLAGRGVTMRRD
jgi:acyl-CoA thioester hydrolase